MQFYPEIIPVASSTRAIVNKRANHPISVAVALKTWYHNKIVGLMGKKISIDLFIAHNILHEIGEEMCQLKPSGDIACINK